jgi:hypothetical protein
VNDASPDPSADPSDHGSATRTVLPLPPDTRTVPLTLLSVPAAAGLRWAREGFAAFVKRPLALAGLFALLMFGIVVLAIVPLLGPVLVFGVLPLVTLVFMLATQAVMHGHFPLPTIAAVPLRTDGARRAALLQLGFLYALASFVLIVVSDAIDGGRLNALLAAMSKGREGSAAVSALLADGRLVFGLIARLGLALALSIPFWHAPALVHWGGQGALQSLFSSTLAIWRNKAAFLLFAVCFGAALGVLGFVANLAGLLFNAPQMMPTLLMPAVLLLSTVYYASLYFTFVDSFGRRGAA